MRLNEEKRLTAEQVRKLPAGSHVKWHGTDKYGEHYWFECTVVQSCKKKVLSYFDRSRLSWTTKPIRDVQGRYFTLMEGEN